jgi:hypothetical protein
MGKLATTLAHGSMGILPLDQVTFLYPNRIDHLGNREVLVVNRQDGLDVVEEATSWETAGFTAHGTWHDTCAVLLEYKQLFGTTNVGFLFWVLAAHALLHRLFYFYFPFYYSAPPILPVSRAYPNCICARPKHLILSFSGVLNNLLRCHGPCRYLLLLYL